MRESVPDPDVKGISLSDDPVWRVNFGVPVTFTFSENFINSGIWSPTLNDPLLANEETSSTVGASLSFRETVLLFWDTSTVFPTESKMLLFTGVIVITSAPFGVPVKAKPRI